MRVDCLILAVITARGGSKRIPGKNIKPFAGRPMIAWPIEAAKASGIFDRIVVSTDSEEIAAVARAWGAEVPFVRPAELSDEFVSAHHRHTPLVGDGLVRPMIEAAVRRLTCGCRGAWPASPT